MVIARFVVSAHRERNRTVLPPTPHLITGVDYWAHRAGDGTTEHPVPAHLDTEATPTAASCTAAVDVLVRTADYLSVALPHTDLHGAELVTPVHGMNLLCAYLAHIIGHLGHHAAADWTELPADHRGEAIGELLAAVHHLQDSAQRLKRVHHRMTHGPEVHP